MEANQDLGNIKNSIQSQNVDDRNVFLAVFDLLLKEYLKSFYSKEVFVIMQSAYFTNFRLPNNWPVLASNLFQASDIENVKDLIKLLRRNNVPVTIECFSEKILRKQYSENSIKNQHNSFLRDLEYMGCTVRESDIDHSKRVFTSQAVLSSSANLTGRGMDSEKQFNDGILILVERNLCNTCDHSIDAHGTDKKCTTDGCSCKDSVQDKPNYWKKFEKMQQDLKKAKPWNA